MRGFLVCLGMILGATLFADTINFEGSSTIKAEIVGVDEDFLYFSRADVYYRVSVKKVESITSKDGKDMTEFYNGTIITKPQQFYKDWFVSNKESQTFEINGNQKAKTDKSFTVLKVVLLTQSLCMAYDQFLTVSDINQTIDDLQKIGVEGKYIREFQRYRTHHVIYGVCYTMSAIYFSFEIYDDLVLQPKYKGMNIEYKF